MKILAPKVFKNIGNKAYEKTKFQMLIPTR